MFEVSVEHSFSAGHALRHYKGKCENVHGHNYKIEITIAGEKLNSIRSGRSLRDSSVKDRFERYIADLDDNEKIALFKFLKGIGQIITGDLEPERAIEPNDPPEKIHMHKKKIQTIKKKPSVKKLPSSDKKPEPGAEDTAAPVPIRAK